ncbi:trypsin-like serine protease [Kitasatospora cineracea]|uniref:trypsin-like serine protease n=1 Tax=Kitasatospora cineracea TaxID=88074 RepID=UPI00380C09A8
MGTLFGRAVAAAAGLLLAVSTAGTSGTASAIVGGSDAPAGAYPYQVSLQQQGSTGWAHICGGPLVQYGRQVGVVSWGSATCNPNSPSVYTNVSAYRAWITARTGI